MLNFSAKYKATAVGKPGGGAEVGQGGQGGWKVHLAQDNKAGRQRPSRT